MFNNNFTLLFFNIFLGMHDKKKHNAGVVNHVSKYRITTINGEYQLIGPPAQEKNDIINRKFAIFWYIVGGFPKHYLKLLK